MHVVSVISPEAFSYGALSGGFYLFNDQANEEWETKIINNIEDVVGRYYSWLPYGVTTIGRPLSIAAYEGRTYLCGGHTYNLVMDEHHRAWKQGIRGPETPPSISGAAGSGNIAYLSWYDELTNERSPLSQGTVIGSGTPRTWQNLPVRPPDELFASEGQMHTSGGIVVPDSASAQIYYLRPGDRIAFPDLAANVSYNLVDEVGIDGVTVDGSGITGGAASAVSVFMVGRATHLELWLSVAGGLPRLVMQVPIGTTQVVESTAAGDLGETFIGAFERFPRCSMNTIYHDRQVLAGDPDNPDTIYLSDLFLPERYAGLSFKTRSGEPVTGLLGMRDFCLIFTRDQTYVLQGYTTSDFTVTPLEQSLGSIGHGCNKIVHGNAYVWTEKGPYMFNGSWHPLSPENEFSQPPADYAGYVRAEVNSDDNTYMVMPYGVFGGESVVELVDKFVWPTNDDQAAMFVFDYTTVQPETGGVLSSARLSMDVQEVVVSGGTSFVEISKSNFVNWYLSNKWGLGRMYLCTFNSEHSSDSFRIYYAPRRSITTPRQYETPSGLTAPSFDVLLSHHYFNKPGRSLEEGKAFQRLWVDAEYHNLDQTGQVIAYPGDEDAYGQTTFPHPTRVYDSGADAASWNLQTYLEWDDTLNEMRGFLIHVFEPPMRLSGRGLTIRVTMPDLGRGGVFKGWGGIYVPGPATRHGLWVDPS